MSVPVRGEHAVVLGASMAGMLAARVAAEHYRLVTVVDRDELPALPVRRRGVPQSAHGHVLQAAGTAVLEELLPGIGDEIAAAGVPVWSDGDLSRIIVEFGGHRLVGSGRLPNPVTNYSPSRPLLDYLVRQRVSALQNVTVLGGHDVVGLMSTEDRSRVTGVVVYRRGTADTTMLAADLVIDATGRGSRAPKFLADLGYDRPIEDELVVNLSYTSHWIALPPGAIREHTVAMFPVAGELTTFALLQHENDSCLMTVGTMAGAKPAEDYADMLVIANRRAPEHIRAALAHAEPVGEIARFRTPSSRWRRYDRLVRSPHGFVVTGDAVCSFNPVYGQGMSVAALDAIALRRCLRGGEQDLPARFFRASAKTTAVAWRNAISADLSLPEVAGKRSLGMRLNNVFTDRVLTAVETDRVVAGQFFRVIGMLDAPARLMRPSMLSRILRANLSRSADRAREPELSLTG